MEKGATSLKALDAMYEPVDEESNVVLPCRHDILWRWPQAEGIHVSYVS